MSRITQTLVFLLTAAFLSGAASGQFGLGSNSEAEAKLYSRIENGEVRVAIEIRIEDGWHLYHEDLGNPDAIGKPTRIELTGEGVEWSALVFPEPMKVDQPGLGTWIYSHEGTIVVYGLGEVEPGATPEIGAKLEGLTCEDMGTCVPYAEAVVSLGRGPDELFDAFPADLAAGGGTASISTTGTAPGRGATVVRTDIDYDAVTFPPFEPQSEQATHGLLIWLLLAFLAGMILNVMPCVLPVISIKVLSFVQQAGEDRKRIFALGLSFAAGIVVVFAALATLAATAGLSWGEQFQSQGFLIVMIGIVFAFALSMFGLYELGVPAAVGAAAGPPREGLADAFFKGMLATVLATPCSGPFLGSTLTWTLAQPPTIIYAIFLALGLGMAFPYVVLTANPAFLKWLPRPGAWMDTFKQAMGFVLLATVIYLMVSLRQDLLLFTSAFLLFVALGCWWWGRFATFDQSSARRLATLAVALGIIGLGSWISFGPFRSLFTQGHEEQAVAWEDFEPDRFEDLLAEGRSVFVDFTASWCPNCIWNERHVYDSAEALEKFAAKGVVRLRADMTYDSPRTEMLERLRDALGARSIPFMALFPAGSPDTPHVRYDIVSKQDMLDLLDSLPAPAGASTAAR